MPHQSKMAWPLPEVVHPPDSICYQVNVPNDRAYIGAFFGAIFLLSKAYAWQNDTAHTALEVGAIWRVIFDNLVSGCSCPGAGGGGGADTDMSIRQNPDNPCEIQSSQDGTTWCTFIDLSKCMNFGTQPGGATDQPEPGGGTQHTCAKLNAYGTLLLPTLVNSGDTIELTSAQGAGWDGVEFDVGPLWRFPNGDQYLGGVDLGFSTTKPGDPLPATNHMQIIAGVGGTPTYLPLIVGAPTTIPSGISNAQIWLQMNDDSLSGNQGSYDVCATVTNNQAVAGPFVVTVDQGTGSASIAPGGTLTLTSDALTNPTLIFHTDRTARLTVLVDNIVVACAGFCNYATMEHPVSTIIQTLAMPAQPHLTDFTPGNLCDRFLAEAGGGGTQFSVAIKFDNP